MDYKSFGSVGPIENILDRFLLRADFGFYRRVGDSVPIRIAYNLAFFADHKSRLLTFVDPKFTRYSESEYAGRPTDRFPVVRITS